MQSSRKIMQKRKQLDPEAEKAFVDSAKGETQATPEKVKESTVKTTLDIPEGLWMKLKHQATNQKRSLRSIMLEAAERWLENENRG